MNTAYSEAFRLVNSERKEKVSHHLPVANETLAWEELKVRVIRRLSEIETLELPWRSLTSHVAAPFQTFTWNLAWYRHFRESYDEPLVFVVERGPDIVSILPAYRQGRLIRLAADEEADYQDLLTASREDGCPSLGAIFQLVESEFPGVRFLFKKIATNGFLYHYFEDETCRREDGIIFVRSMAPCPFVSIDGGLETYLASLPAKRRQDMKRALRRFDKEMPVARLEMVRNLEIQVRDLESIAEFHIEYFRKDGTSPLQNSALIGMLGEVAKDPDVGLQLGALIDQGEILAIDIGFARAGCYFGYLTGFHPGFQKFAPGKCLLLKRIDRWVEEDGVKVLDFLSGDEPYKTGFTAGESYDVKTLHWMPNRMPCRARRATLIAERLGRRIVKRAVSKIVHSK